MSKSLEALNKLCDLATQDGDCLNYVIGISGIIKQDLEAHEQLKQDHDKTLINNGELVVKIADLQKENQELLVNKNFAQGVALKYKNAIEILKDILNLNVTQDKHNNYFLDGDIITEITKEQYYLLKEVLE